jgi:hypothetical protein
MATPIMLSKRQIKQAELHRQAVVQFARMAAKRAVQAQMREQGIRLTLVFPAIIAEKAREYLDAHPELYQLALERANKLGYVDPLYSNLRSAAQRANPHKSITSTVQISGAK